MRRLINPPVVKGSIIKSGGELQNDESSARVIRDLLCLIRAQPALTGVRRISLHYSDHSYIILQTPPRHQVQVIKATREANALQIDAEAEAEADLEE